MLKYFAALNQLEKLTPLRFARLLKFFRNDAEQIWKATRREWQEAGVEFKAVTEIFVEKEKINPDTTFAELEKIGATEVVLGPPFSGDWKGATTEIFEEVKQRRDRT